MLYAIGHPGAQPRLLLSASDTAQAAGQMLEGEVCVPIVDAGDYVIAPDGQSASPRVPTDDELWAAIRAKRNALLEACQWTQFRDASDTVATAWAPYRQALKDIPQTFSSPTDVVWPTPPSDVEQQ